MPCLDCGAPGHRRLCPTCTRGRNRRRGSTTQRGYGSRHQSERAAWQERIDAGEPAVCWRPDCDAGITSGMAWHLGHSDDGAETKGPEGGDCNLHHAGRAAHRQ